MVNTYRSFSRNFSSQIHLGKDLTDNYFIFPFFSFSNCLNQNLFLHANDYSQHPFITTDAEL